MDPSWQPVLSAAQRRKQRRLRSWWRHEQQSIAAALATYSHHSALRGQKTARARGGGEVDEMKYTAKFRKTPPPQAFFQLYDEEDAVWGLRPACLAEPQGPQAGIQRHTMEHIADLVPMVQILDIPALLGADQLVEVGRHLDLHVPEQAIEVPKISSSPRPPNRRFLFPVRMAEQLVEVPTIISYSMLRTIGQTMDIPVPRVREGGGGGLQGFLPGQGIPAAGVEQNVEIPVPQRRRNKIGGFQGFFPGQNSTADVEQNVDIPARGGLHGFLPGQGSSSSSRFPGGADEGIQGGFRTFSHPGKSAGWGPHSGSELGADFTPWTPAAYAESMAGADDEFMAESEAEVEEDAVTRFAAGFRPMRVCERFLLFQQGRPVRGCAYGDRCTFAHSWAELHPEASEHELYLASLFPE